MHKDDNINRTNTLIFSDLCVRHWESSIPSTLWLYRSECAPIPVSMCSVTPWNRLPRYPTPNERRAQQIRFWDRLIKVAIPSAMSGRDTLCKLCASNKTICYSLYAKCPNVCIFTPNWKLKKKSAIDSFKLKVEEYPVAWSSRLWFVATDTSNERFTIKRIWRREATCI